MKKLCLVLMMFLFLNIGLASCSIRDGINMGNNQDNTKSSGSEDGDVMDKGPVEGGVLRLFSTIPDTLNPVLTANSYVHDFSELISEGLVRLDKTQRPVPELAEKWEVSDDGLTWTFYIKDGIEWHDGMPFTAEDVEFTFQTILNPKVTSVYKKNLENVAAFTAMGRNVFKITLKAPNSFFAKLMTFPIICKHYFNGEDILKTTRNLAPMGTGPYKFLSYDGRTVVKLILNEKWWKAALSDKKDRVLPYVGEIDIMLYKNSKDSLNAFQTKDVDVTFIEARDFSKYNGRNDLTLKKYTSNNYDFIAINLQNSVLSDKAVRQALAYAINKVDLIKNVMPGEAVASDLPILPDTWLYNNDILYYQPSTSKAREILKENGWNEDSVTGEFSKYGKSLSFELLVNEDNDLRSKIADELSKQLYKAGIKLNVVKVKWDDLIKKINTKQYELALMGWRVHSTEDLSFGYSSLETGWGKMNVSGYKNPEVDSYLKQILAENDDTRRKALFFNMRSIINEDVPYIGLYFYNNGVLISNKIRGEANPYVWKKYDGFNNWYIPVR
jgi:peptide/nickel transport system substrate-binding protein